MLLISSSRFEDHITPPGHPERPERAHVFDAVAAGWLQNGGRVEAPRPATREELEAAHTAAHVARIAATAGRAAMLDPDTYTSSDSETIAHLAAGAAVQAAQHALAAGEPALALVRPPGHHAESDRAMGFCLFNNAAIAAAAALRSGVERVAIVDVDVHHGNGTQQIFYEDPRVLYVSTHQYPFYPGTGAAGETGRGSGAGFTVNVPMEAGCGDGDYALVYRAIVEPVLAQFAPRLTIVSAGFDAHAADPLASMRVSTAGYARVIRGLHETASRAGSAFALVTEGGYDLEALGACLRAALDAIATPSNGAPASDDAPEMPAATRRGQEAVRAARAAQAPWWRGL